LKKYDCRKSAKKVNTRQKNKTEKKKAEKKKQKRKNRKEKNPGKSRKTYKRTKIKHIILTRIRGRLL